MPDTIYNTALHHRWHDFKYDLTTLNLPIDPKFLYALNMNNQILGFCYGLLQSRKDVNKMIVIIRIIPHPDYESQNLWSSSYRHLEPLTKSILNIPLNIFICKRLHIEVNEAPKLCTICKKTKYYIGNGPTTTTTTFPNTRYICLNTICSSFSFINLDKIPVYNNGGEIICTYQHIQQNSELRNNTSILAVMSCTKCNSCKQCTKKRFVSSTPEKCKRHKICTHTTKSSFRKRDMIHSLNLLSHDRAKARQRNFSKGQQQH